MGKAAPQVRDKWQVGSGDQEICCRSRCASRSFVDGEGWTWVPLLSPDSLSTPLSGQCSFGIADFVWMDAPINGLDEPKQSKCAHACRRRSEQYPSVRLGTQTFERSTQPFYVIGILVECGQQDKPTYQQKHDSTRSESHSSERDGPALFCRVQLHKLRDVASPAFQQKPSACRDGAKTDNGHQPTTQGHAHEPGSPVASGLVFRTSSALPTECKIKGECRKSGIDETRADMCGSYAKSLIGCAPMICVRQALDEPPCGEPGQS